MISHATPQHPPLQRIDEYRSRLQAPPVETPRSTSAYSLAQVRLQRGEPIVEPEGNLGWRYQIAKRILDIVGRCDSAGDSLAGADRGLSHSVRHDSRPAADPAGTGGTFGTAVWNVQIPQHAAGC